MNYAAELAKELNQRNNVKRIGNIVGEVLSVEPFKIGILGNEVMLDKTNCFICNNLKEGIERKATMKIDEYTIGAISKDSRGDTISSLLMPLKNDYNAVITYKEILEIGDKVLVISDAEGQYFFIVDRIEVI